VLFPLLREATCSEPRITNVASVPQRSPFRYPGGKTWLVPEIRAWLRGLPYHPRVMVEPFAGGGIASLTAAFERLAEQVVMCELDENVAALWHLVLEDADWLIGQIESFEITAHNVERILRQELHTPRDRGFMTLVMNRTQRGGIMARGASRMKNGENGRGLASRWYPRTLARRIREIQMVRSRIRFIQGDGFAFIREYSSDPDVAFFVDPPYTAGGKRAGKRLYDHNELDHAGLFELMAAVAGDFLMTYDDAPEVHELARKHDFSVSRVPMKNTHHAHKYELLIRPSLRARRLENMSPAPAVAVGGAARRARHGIRFWQ
jgi:DNA adenine methylase